MAKENGTKSTKKPISVKITTAQKHKVLVDQIQALGQIVTRTKRNIRLLNGFVFLMFAGTISGGFLLFQKINTLSDNHFSFVDSNQPLDNAVFNREQNTKLNQLTEKIAILQQNLKDTDRNTKSALVDIKNTLKVSKNIALNKARLLISDAMRLLDVQNQNKKAAFLLQKSAMILQKDSGLKTIVEQNILNQAAIDLLKMQALDHKSVIKTLLQITPEIDNLVFVKPNNSQKNNSKKYNKNNELSFVDTVWSDIKNLIKIRTDNDKSIGKLISVKSKSMAIMLVKLQLKHIQMSVIVANQPQFDDELSVAISLVNNIFDKNDVRTIVFLNQLKNLQNKHIALDELPESIDLVRQILQS